MRIVIENLNCPQCNDLLVLSLISDGYGGDIEITPCLSDEEPYPDAVTISLYPHTFIECRSDCGWLWKVRQWNDIDKKIHFNSLRDQGKL